MIMVFVCASYGVTWILPEYAGAAALMRLIAPLLLVKCVCQIASGAFMISLGRVRMMASLSVFGGFLNMGLNLFFIPWFGVNGAVYSTLIGHTLVGIATMIYVGHVLRHLQLKKPSGSVKA